MRALERLNQHWFTSLTDAREKIEAWRVDYNTQRPHSSLGYHTPEEFAAARAAALRSLPPATEAHPDRVGVNTGDKAPERHIMIGPRTGGRSASTSSAGASS